MFNQMQKTKEQKKNELLGTVRKVVLVVGMLCFLSTVTGVTLQLHLLSHEHNKQHDHEDCDICKNFFAVNQKFILNSYTTMVFFEHFARNTQYSKPTIPGLFRLEAFNPRPPPFAS
jgi:membrane-anchored glycerophosphoryl diester phosphodiesterase (GDPDase)